jgi:translation initiation factor 1 (eIF-1/SUI1)
MSKKNPKKKGVIYSTNTEFEFEYESDQIKTLKAKEQNLKICIDKHRSGKAVVIIKGYLGS